MQERSYLLSQDKKDKYYGDASVERVKSSLFNIELGQGLSLQPCRHRAFIWAIYKERRPLPIFIGLPVREQNRTANDHIRVFLAAIVSFTILLLLFFDAVQSSAKLKEFSHWPAINTVEDCQQLDYVILSNLFRID